jgi:hypothetical protein
MFQSPRSQTPRLNHGAYDMRLTQIILVAIATIALSVPAEAKYTLDLAAKAPYPFIAHHTQRQPRHLARHRVERRRMVRHSAHAELAYARASEGEIHIIGGRPSGCPHAYCGCGLRKYLGLDDVRLNLAWNWATLFPREYTPRPGLAAVRSHHVMYIEAEAGNGLFLIRDYNSGGGLSRLHVRDVRGYVFVNPHGARAELSTHRHHLRFARR